MSWLQFIAAIVASVAWPLAVIAIVWVLRDSIRRVLLTVTNLKYKDLEVDFGRELKELEEKARVIDITPTKDTALPSDETRNSYHMLADAERLVDELPVAAVALAWTSVERELLNAVMRLAVSPDSPTYNSAIANAMWLTKGGAMNDATFSFIEEMWKLRNAAIHRSDSRISPDEAREYISIAKGVVAKLRSLKR